MESPSSTVRRRAWIQSSRLGVTLEDPDPQASGCGQSFSSHMSMADDDVFSDGCSTGKIESWLLGCGLETGSENFSHFVEPLLKASASFEDDLSLGADAFALKDDLIGPEMRSCPVVPSPSKPCIREVNTSTPHQKPRIPSLSQNYSIASSSFSSSTSITASSVSEVLQLCEEDAEETLYQLGFGYDQPQVPARIPRRFLAFPSRLQGINFRLFLECQLQRIRDEDPNLSLASRFRQVEVLTAMANAFYSLYSHVSRTPLQKLPPPEFSLSPSPTQKRFMAGVRSEPRSPVERLKDTVSKMCLYTGSSRGSDSTSPQASPRKRSSLPDVIGVVMDNAKKGASRTLNLEQDDMPDPPLDTSPNGHSDIVAETGLQERRQETAVDTVAITGHDKKLESEQSDMAEVVEDAIKRSDLDGAGSHSLSPSISPPLSGQTVIEMDQEHVSDQQRLEGCSSPGLIHDVAENTVQQMMPVPKVTFDIICPQIVESVNQASSYYQQIHGVHWKDSPQVSTVKDKSPDKLDTGSQKRLGFRGQLAKNKSRILTSFDEADEDCDSNTQEAGEVTSNSPCSITVTGWESDDVTSSYPTDSFHSSSCLTDQISQQLHGWEKSTYLSPVKHQALGQVNLKQANSFELEEVQSAGEEDVVQSEATRQVTSPLFPRHISKGLMVRGDSMQSDSSGYADEDVHPSSDRQGS